MMKILASVFACLISLSAFSQPFTRNFWDTNNAAGSATTPFGTFYAANGVFSNSLAIGTNQIDTPSLSVNSADVADKIVLSTSIAGSRKFQILNKGFTEYGGVPPTGSSRLTLRGGPNASSGTNDEIGISQYHFGANLFYKAPFGNSDQFEIMGYDMIHAGYGAIVTFVVGESTSDGTVNGRELQIRNVVDGDSLVLRYPDTGNPRVTTQGNGTMLEISPNNADLLLNTIGGSVRVTNISAANNPSAIIAPGLIRITAPTNAVAPPVQVLQPIGYFASMMLTNTNTVTIGAGSTYYVLTNFTTLRTNGFVTIGTNGFITNVTAGFYRITCNVSMVGGGSDTVEGALFLDDTRKPEITVFGTFDNPARVRTMSATGILYIPASTGISFRLSNNSDTDNISVWRAGVTIGTP